MRIHKTILLAGGAGTRLYPLTQVASKQLLPVYNKPMVYYPLSTLMLLGMREILVISTPVDTPRLAALLGDGARLGLSIEYAVQPEPKGIAQAFLVGADFVGADPAALILADNVFYGTLNLMRDAVQGFAGGGLVFGYPVKDPQRYGVVEFDRDGRAVGIEEKPARPRSHYAVPGLYLYDGSVVARARALQPSARGELEITDLNRAYLAEGALQVVPLGRGVAWLDTGTYESLLDAASFIEAVETRQGMMVSCPEEIAIRRGYIDDAAAYARLCAPLPAGPYREYVEAVWREHSAEEQGIS